MKSFLQLLFACSILWAAPAFAEDEMTPMTEFSVSGLKDGEQLLVGYYSQGCFHYDVGTIEIHGGKAYLHKEIDGEMISYAPYTLTFHEISALDRYIVWLEKQTGEGLCTTQKEFQLIRTDIDGREIKGQLNDGYCGFGRRDEKQPMLDFENLAYKIQRFDETGVVE